MINSQMLENVLPIFFEHQGCEDTVITQNIKRLGLSLKESERITAFIPSAFCRVALSEQLDIEFLDSYKVNNLEKQFSYSDEPIYQTAIELASEIMNYKPELSEIFNSIVVRSAECNVINKALNEGADITGNSLSPVIYFGYKTLGKKQTLFDKLLNR
ncbi:hypothetical protein [Pseudoalteromonas denitrificans]|uniref:Uncharacterized protein n=1 Tax=Pseudoalteromonas denitrificans DSM 6059 TaxID=1123010 RepID=A0A1I1UY47_9GAMM|nr:hypothetical protein [Pseudoalteromonas denitrificans]SFD75485.1 hypothetical protein SAMN02745724_05364 [Pseudoalteromonas denitrificans DSM 6059]